VRVSSGRAVSDVGAHARRSSALGRRKVSRSRLTHPYRPPCSWWDAHAVLTRSFARRGFSFPSLLALRVLSEGVYPALSTVLLGFWLAVRDADEEIGAARGRW
jgi:hypothetical protein